MKLIKPDKLQKGDTIGIISPSSGLASLVPHRVRRGVETLEGLGFRVRLSPNALEKENYTSGTPEARAADINAFFADTSIKAIMAMIGGYHTNQLLSHLDFTLLRNNPKIIIGYSDMTVLHLALQKETGLTTFYGPALLTQFGEYPEILSYTKEYFLKAISLDLPVGNIEPSILWTDELLNWLRLDDVKRPRRLNPNRPRMWLRKGKATGALNGGCITSLQHLRGTKYWPDFSGSLFFWDIPESKDLVHGVSCDIIDSLLTDLELSDVFGQIAGMIVGKPYGYNDTEEELLRKIILERTKRYSFPILYNVEIGHVDPIITIPLGASAHIDSEKNLFQILEPGVQTNQNYVSPMEH